MNPTAMGLAQARFQAALSSGASAAPVALNHLLTQLSMAHLPTAFDSEPLWHSTKEEFSFLRSMIASETSPDAAASAAWEGAIRWLLTTLSNWDSNETNSFNKLRALLSAVSALDANLAGITSVASHVASNQLISGLQRLIESADAAPCFNDRRFSEQRQRIESLANSGNLDQLVHMVPHMDFFLSPDFGTAVVFIYNAKPDALASIIEKRNNILFSLMICSVLGTQAITLASRVNNLVFKFVSIVNARRGRILDPQQSSQIQLQTLLLQVAKTSPTDWSIWMKALFKYPGQNPALDTALAAVLQQLSQEHWTSFFKALSLNYSYRAAAPVANILIPFANSPNIEGKALMWSTAYQAWTDWGYGQHESDCVMFAPVACALDFPVAMYYASLPSDECLAVVRNLIEVIETVEQRWFNSVTDLVTERNRLKSRLRLVQHGIELANGSLQALPPAVQPDTDLYARTRYHYHNVNE